MTNRIFGTRLDGWNSASDGVTGQVLNAPVTGQKFSILKAWLTMKSGLSAVAGASELATLTLKKKDTGASSALTTVGTITLVASSQDAIAMVPRTSSSDGATTFEPGVDQLWIYGDDDASAAIEAYVEVELDPYTRPLV